MSRIRAAKRVRFSPLALTTVLLSAGLLSLSVTGTLSGFTASITNSANTAATGTLVMQEQTTASTPVTCTSTDGGSITTSSATCSTINKFGGSTAMAPGAAVSTSVVIKNTGTVNANTFTLTPGTTCTQTNSGSQNGTATDLCSKLALTITQNGNQFFSGTLASFAGSAASTLNALTAGGSSTFVFTVTLSSSATNAYEGLQAAVPMTWTFNS